jgi:hypothetical protein
MSSGNKKRGSLELSSRDLSLLYALWQARYYTTTQLAALFWRGGPVSALRSAQRRLRQMEAVGLVRRVEPWIKRSEGNRPFIYALGAQAPGLLCQTFDIEVAALDWKPKTSLENNFLFMDHLLATNDFQIAVTLSSEKQGLSLERWVDERELKKKEMRAYVELAEAEGQSARVAVIPDSFFVIQTERGTGHFCVEIDRGTVTIAPRSGRGWAQKIQSYLLYHASGAYEQRFHARHLRVLTVTTSLERLLRMKQTTEEAGGNSQFWFTTFDQIVHTERVAIKQSATDPAQVKYVYLPVYHEELLTGPVWYRAGSDRLHSLLE